MSSYLDGSIFVALSNFDYVLEMLGLIAKFRLPTESSEMHFLCKEVRITFPRNIFPSNVFPSNILSSSQKLKILKRTENDFQKI